jgi:superfamily II DNA or RNA helicase
MAVADSGSDDQPWTLPPSRKREGKLLEGLFPEEVSVVRGNMVFIPKAGLPEAMLNRILRVAAFQNPEFYRAQAMRLSTWDKPRVIFCGEELEQHVAVPQGLTPLVLTGRKDHQERLATGLSGMEHVLVLKGGMGTRERRSIAEQLAATQEDGPRVILATGSYIGEGFDDARLDTLFLTMPISWRGTLQQYVGRLHRVHHGEKVVRVYDYVDACVPILARRYEKRLRGYRAIGYVPESEK